MSRCGCHCGDPYTHNAYFAPQSSGALRHCGCTNVPIPTDRRRSPFSARLSPSCPLLPLGQPPSARRNRSLPKSPVPACGAAARPVRHATVDVAARLSVRQLPPARRWSSPPPPAVVTPPVHPGSHALPSRRYVSARKPRCIAVERPPSASPWLILDHYAWPPRPPGGSPHLVVTVDVIAPRPHAQAPCVLRRRWGGLYMSPHDVTLKSLSKLRSQSSS